MGSRRDAFKMPASRKPCKQKQSSIVVFNAHNMAFVFVFVRSLFHSATTQATANKYGCRNHMIHRNKSARTHTYTCAYITMCTHTRTQAHTCEKIQRHEAITLTMVAQSQFVWLPMLLPLLCYTIQFHRIQTQMFLCNERIRINEQRCK